jgi:hypothetical protein
MSTVENLGTSIPKMTTMGGSTGVSPSWVVMAISLAAIFVLFQLGKWIFRYIHVQALLFLDLVEKWRHSSVVTTEKKHKRKKNRSRSPSPAASSRHRRRDSYD